MATNQSADDSPDSDSQLVETKSGAIIRAYVERQLTADRAVHDEGLPLFEVDGIGIVYAHQVEDALTEVMKHSGVRESAEDAPPRESTM